MKSVTVSEKNRGLRLDQFLLTQYPAITRKSAKEIIKNNYITFDGIHKSSNYRVQAGERFLIDEEKLIQYVNENNNSYIVPKKMNLDIIYNDDSTIVVNKPVGIPTHPVSGHKENSVLNGLTYLFPETKIRTIHRLDVETSGILIFAKTLEAQRFYSEQFEKSLVEKVYYAVVIGNFYEFLQKQGKSDLLVRSKLKRSDKNNKRMIESEIGANAVTNFFSEKILKNKYGIFNLVKAIPKTGRTHQIRVHLSNLGFPILGDKLYGEGKFPRLMLHSKLLTIKDFSTKKEVTYSADLPPIFRTLKL